MENKTILLISLQEDVEIIGLKQLHYQLMEKYDSKLLYLPNLNSLDKILHFIKEIDPIFIGISLMSGEYYKAKELTNAIRNSEIEIPIIWGGIHPTISPESCVHDTDYVCIGEADKMIFDFADNINNPENVKNLCYIKDGDIVKNELYSPIENLDELPFYDYVPINSYIQDKSGEIVPLNKKMLKKYSRFSGAHYSIISSRGCPFSCAYCCNNFLSKLYSDYPRVRRRSVDSIIEELKTISDNKDIKMIAFQDDCFMSNSEENIEKFCYMHKNKINKSFSIHSIPIYVTENKVRLFKDAGMSWLSLGLQTGSDRVNKEIYKRRSLKSDFIKAVDIAKKYDVSTFCDVILDNPLESNEESLETINTLMSIPKPFHPQIFSLTLYEGTELHNNIFSHEDYCKKNYAMYEKTTINKMIRLSCFLPKSYMSYLVNEYQKGENRIKFIVSFWILNWLSLLMIEPIYYFRLIRMANNGSYLNALKNIPNLLKRGIHVYKMQLKKS